MPAKLQLLVLPDLDIPIERPAIPGDQFAARCDELVHRAGTDWVVVTGDREHSANLLFLCGYDPRFEEGILVLGRDSGRVLLVGTEGMGYLEHVTLPCDVRLYEPLSLMAQPRGGTPNLVDILAQIGVTHGQSAGMVGWKYAGPDEEDPSAGPAYVAAVHVRGVAKATGGNPVDLTPIMMNPVDGLRSRNSAIQLAQFEWGSARASAAVLRVSRAAKPGMTEFEAAANMQYAGEPISMHPILSSTAGQIQGLRSPSNRVINEGDGITCGIGYWGGLCCRAGIMTGTIDEAWLETYVFPYLTSQAAWWSTVGIGVTGGTIDTTVRAAMANAPFKPFLNPSHLVSYDEWVHSVVAPGSTDTFASGNALQCDIIPLPLPDSRGMNCEDTAALADERLRDEIRSDFPAMWARIEARRALMQDGLGISLKPEVLPLSHAPAYYAPFWLAPELVVVHTS